jgi:hydroxyacylglutathione hydrolase
MQITKQIHALKIRFQIPLSADKKIERSVYAYLLYGERIWLIDSGVAAAVGRIFDSIRENGRDPKDIAGIVLTHSHPDHIGAAKIIHDETGCIIAAHGAEQGWIEDVDLQARERPVPGFHSLVSGPVRVSRVLNQGDVLDLDNDRRLQVIHTPGHSAGSISLLLRDEGVLFTGDAVPVSGDMPIYEDALASSVSLDRLKEISGITCLLSSWDDPRQGAAAYESLEKGSAYLSRIHEAVLTAARSLPSGDAMVRCAQVLRELGMPPDRANPLIARSLQSNLRLGNSHAFFRKS